ncbi:MAG: hypothetical protein GX774_01180 [Armatimonadetes bacterium]|nr:hypothetical protein [Armatimonadota bacterium]
MRRQTLERIPWLIPEPGLRRCGALPPFDPADGKTVLAPPAAGPGCWSGASDVVFDDRAGRFYLYARTRWPKDPDDPEPRGARCAIYDSRDGHTFTEIWSARSTQFDADALEKGSLLILPDGRHRLYLSRECPGGQGWQIDLLEAETFAALDPARRQPVLTPTEVGAGQVKDPVVVLAGGLTLLYANVSVPGGGEATGLAVSADGVRFEWRGPVLPPGMSGAWDCWTARATGVLYAAPAWYLFYDGAAAASECDEEQTGVAVGFTPERFTRLTPEGPLAPGAPRGGLRYDGDRILPSIGAVRYLTPILAKNRILYYFEWTRPDGSHELRVADYDLG